MRFIWSGWLLKLLIGTAIVVAVVGTVTSPSHDTPCTTVSSIPDRSSVYECKAGLSSVFFRNTTKVPIFATLTSSSVADGWVTESGANVTAKTARKLLGPSVVLNKGAYMAVSTPAQGSVVAYVLAKTTVVLTVVWNVQTTQ